MDKAANPSPGFQRNPSRRITVEPFDGAVTVTFSDAIIASSGEALVLREEDYPPVFYIPFKDIYFDFLTRSNTSTHCPYKGDASYWDVSAVGESAKDIMWAYEAPYDEMARIKDHGAFYPDKVRIEANPSSGAVGADL
ncbi:DUF427 domain-containing protein [Mesorhizobium sp. WSM2239]|uniref:DUF427 domain-containing protein n=2 Tax=unclassified Mesorhizobium TaxID=325217 RepID=A0AAU8D521_9HYPH